MAASQNNTYYKIRLYDLFLLQGDNEDDERGVVLQWRKNYRVQKEAEILQVLSKNIDGTGTIKAGCSHRKPVCYK